MDYFRNSYRYEWSNTDGLSNLLKYQNAAQTVAIDLPMPVLTCYGCLGNGWTALFQMNVVVTIYRTRTKKKELLNSNMYRYEDDGDTTVYKTFYGGPTSISNANNAVYYASGNKAYLRKIRDASGYMDKNTAGSFSDYYTTTSVLAQVDSQNTTQRIAFSIPALSLQEIDSGIGYRYDIVCTANPINTNAMYGYYEAIHSGDIMFTQGSGLSLGTKGYTWRIYTSNATYTVDPSYCKVNLRFFHQDMTITSNGGPLITKGEKYSAYQLLRKALLTCDTHIIDNSVVSLDEYHTNENGIEVVQQSIDYPIIFVDTPNQKWSDRLKTTKIYETIFESSNLWEILLQIGYYLHAIPYLEFAEDGTDRFVLRFKQLGDTRLNEDNSTKITVFNSRNLSDYFTQYDSYVTNLFSPQNLIEEWVVCKTSDSSYLVSNNTAELQLAYAITEIVEFDISIQINGQWVTRSALDYIFEKSIYDVLSNDNPYQVFPTKGSAVYYNLGDNKIQGLSFVPPSVNSGDFPMALKRIVQLVFQGLDIPSADSLRFNNLQFHVKYRTQDTARINQYRPDIENFMKNSSYEKYPHHEQWYNQESKIVDSERFSANLYGKLVRVGNCIYQRQEYVQPGASEKESGELVMINGSPYYITEVENEFYPDAVYQKVTYSKNFNQLSQIVTIPSEPRFYEVSEQSKIKRPFRIPEFFALDTRKNTVANKPTFLNNSIWRNFIRGLIFNDIASNVLDKDGKNVVLPNYAWVRFAVDQKRDHPYPNSQMFPSSLLERSSNLVSPKSPSDHADVIVPVAHYPLHDGLVISWKMADNFMANEFVDSHIYYNDRNTTNDDAYLAQQPVRYVDIYGRADLFNFRLFNKYKLDNAEWTKNQSQMLPRAVIEPARSKSIAAVQGNSTTYIALDKDCREEIQFNYQIILTYKDENFITFANLFGQKEVGKLKIALLNKMQSQFNENLNITDADILADSANGDIDYSLLDSNTNSIEVRFTLTKNIDLADVKAIVLYQGTQSTGRSVYIIKNVHNLSDSDKLQSWWIYPVFTDNSVEGVTDYSVNFVYTLNNVTTTLESQAVEYGAFATAPTLSLDDYTFNGWSLDGVHAVNVDNYRITTNTTFVALLDENALPEQYTYTFVANGSEYEVQTFEYGEYSIAPSTAPTKSGHTFKYWALAGSGSSPLSGEVILDTSTATTDYVTANTGAMITYGGGNYESRTWYAVWYKNQVTHTVTFIANGQNIAQYNVENNTTTSVPNYSADNFLGWTIDGTNLVNLNTYLIRNDTTFIAKFGTWQPVSSCEILSGNESQTISVRMNGLQAGKQVKIDSAWIRFGFDYTSEYYFFNSPDGNTVDPVTITGISLRSTAPTVVNVGVIDYDNTPNQVTISISCETDNYLTIRCSDTAGCYVDAGYLDGVYVYG